MPEKYFPFCNLLLNLNNTKSQVSDDVCDVTSRLRHRFIKWEELRLAPPLAPARSYQYIRLQPSEGRQSPTQLTARCSSIQQQNFTSSYHGKFTLHMMISTISSSARRVQFPRKPLKNRYFYFSLKDLR